MLCHYMGDPQYTDAVINGDIHSTNQEAAGLEFRHQSKTFFYGFLFGAGDAKIGKIVGGSTKEGRQLKAKFFKALPKLKVLVDNVKKATEARGFLYGLDGRKIWCTSAHKSLNSCLLKVIW